jgi:hypothetical protein
MKPVKTNLIWPALAFLALSAQAYAGDDIRVKVISAGSDDIGAFDAALARSAPQGASKPAASRHANFGAVVSAEARKTKDERAQDLQSSKNFGQWVKGQTRPSANGAEAVGEDQGGGNGNSSSQSARDQVKPTGHKGSGNSNGNSQH